MASSLSCRLISGERRWYSPDHKFTDLKICEAVKTVVIKHNLQTHVQVVAPQQVKEMSLKRDFSFTCCGEQTNCFVCVPTCKPQSYFLAEKIDKVGSRVLCARRL